MQVIGSQPPKRIEYFERLRKWCKGLIAFALFFHLIFKRSRPLPVQDTLSQAPLLRGVAHQSGRRNFFR